MWVSHEDYASIIKMSGGKGRDLTDLLIKEETVDEKI